jgi:hypothetical protein
MTDICFKPIAFMDVIINMVEVQMNLHVEYEHGRRWALDSGGAGTARCYGTSRKDAAAKVEALALRAKADRLDEGEMEAPPSLSRPWNVLRHEPMGAFESVAGLGRAAPDRLARQTTVKAASNPHQIELAGRGVCVS